MSTDSGSRSHWYCRPSITAESEGFDRHDLKLPGRQDDPVRAVAAAEAGPGESAEVTVELPRRAFEVGDEEARAWAYVKGSYEITAGRSIADRRLTAAINV